MECTEQMYIELAEKCKDNYEGNWDLEVNLALDKMDKWRCPLNQVNQELHNFIMDMVEEYCDDNEIDFDEFYYDIDEILFTIV